MPQEIAEQSPVEQLPVPNPVRAETLAEIQIAQERIKTTHCSPDSYNTCTEVFEGEREICKQESCDARALLLGEVQNDILKAKDISELTINEAKTLLSLSNSEYGNLQDGFNLLGVHTYSEIGDKADARIFQGALIEKAYGLKGPLFETDKDGNKIMSLNPESYSNDFIFGSGKERGGNFVISPDELEQELRTISPNEWNSLAVANYFSMLQTKGELNIPKLMGVIGVKQLAQLQKLWSEGGELAKEQLSKNTDTAFIIHGVKNLDYSSLFSDPKKLQELAPLLDEFSPEDLKIVKEQFFNYFQNNPDTLDNFVGFEDLGDATGIYKEIILQARLRKQGELLKTQLKSIYPEDTGIHDLLDAFVIFAIENPDGNVENFSFDGINEIITEYNIENESLLPLLDTNGEIALMIQTLFNASSISANYAETFERSKRAGEKIKEIQDTIHMYQKELRDAKNSGDDSSVASLNKEIERLQRQLRYTSEYVDRAEQVEKDFDISQTILQDLSSGKGKLSESQLQRIAITGPLKSLIQEIKNPEQIVEFFKKYAGNIREGNINLSDLYGPQLENIAVVSSFPGNISPSDISLLPDSILQDPVFHDFIIQKGNNEELIKYTIRELITRGNLPVETLHTICLGIHKKFPLTLSSTIYFSKEFQEYDKNAPEKILSSENEIKIVNKEDFLAALKKISILNEENNEVEIGKLQILINSYIYQNGIDSESIGLLTKALQDSKGNGFNLYAKLSSIHSLDSPEALKLHEMGLRQDPNNFISLTQKLKGNKDIIRYLVDSIKTIFPNGLNNLDYIYIQNWQDALDVGVIIYDALGKKMTDFSKENNSIGLGPKSIQKISFFLKDIPKTELEQILKERNSKSEVYLRAFKLVEDFSKASDFAQQINAESQKISESPNTPFLANNTFAIIDGLKIPETEKQKIKELLQKAFRNGDLLPSDVLTLLFAKIPVESRRKVIEDLRQALKIDYENLEKTTYIPLKINPEISYDTKVWEILDRGENNTLSPKKDITGIFLAFRNSLAQKQPHLSQEAYILLFLEAYKIPQEDTQLRQTIENRIRAQLGLTKTRSTSSEEILRHWEDGTLDEYYADVEKKIYSGEIPLASTKDEKISPVTQGRSEVNSSHNLQDMYREISSELQLSPEESQSLTVEELQLLASNEKAKENFINFRQTLVDLNLDDIWQFRTQIFRAIGSLDFNLSDGNYIGENELNIFLTKVSYATLGKEKVPELQSIPSNIQTTITIIRRENKLGVITGQKDKSAVGSGGGIIETAFRQKFAPKDAGMIGLKTSAFLEALKA